MKFKLTHVLLVGLLFVVAFSNASTYMNGTIRMGSNADTYSGSNNPSPAARITKAVIVSAGGAKTYWLRNGTASTSEIFWGKTVNGTAGTTTTVEVNFDTPNGGPIFNPSKGLYLSTDDSYPTGTLFLYTNLNQ